MSRTTEIAVHRTKLGLVRAEAFWNQYRQTQDLFLRLFPFVPIEDKRAAAYKLSWTGVMITGPICNTPLSLETLEGALQALVEAGEWAAAVLDQPAVATLPEPEPEPPPEPDAVESEPELPPLPVPEPSAPDLSLPTSP